MEISISSARVEEANLQTIRETRLNICSRSEVVQSGGEGGREGKKLGNRVRGSQLYRASYEIPEAISEGESNESSRVAMARGKGLGLSLRVKEIIGDTVLDPLYVRPFEMAILSNPPRVLPANGKCPHISVPTVMDIVGWW